MTPISHRVTGLVVPCPLMAASAEFQEKVARALAPIEDLVEGLWEQLDEQRKAQTEENDG